MSISRRKLEQHGEPFGDCATRKKFGGGYCCGVGGDSSSSSTSNPSDRRIAAAPSSVSVSGDGSSVGLQMTSTNKTKSGNGVNVDAGGNVSVTSIDAGAIGAGVTIARDAIDLATTGTRLANQNITEVLGTVDDLSGKYTRATGDALNAGIQSSRDALDFARSNDARFVAALESLTNKTITVAQRAQSDVVGAYQNSADTTSGVRQIVMGGLVIAGIVAVAALKGKL